MAYEGFQLLTYDYEDIDDPDRTRPAATFSAVAFVALVYVIVTLGTSMLVGADRIVENEGWPSRWPAARPSARPG